MELGNVKSLLYTCMYGECEDADLEISGRDVGVCRPGRVR